MKPGPHRLVDIILTTTPPDAPPKELVLIVREIIISEDWFDTEEKAVEKAGEWLTRTRIRLVQVLEELAEDGRPADVCFNTSSDEHIQGACFIQPNDTEQVKESKQSRLLQSNYHHSLLNLTPDQFEDICGKVLGLLGVDEPKVSRRSADEGIDFFGKLSLSSLLFPEDIYPTIQKQLSIWLVGQAKRYINSQLGTAEIREIVGSVVLGRSKAFGSLDAHYEKLDIRIADPVFTMIITSSTISRNARRLLKKAGVIGVDGNTLSAFLADRKSGLTTDAFSEPEFLAWISS